MRIEDLKMECTRVMPRSFHETIDIRTNSRHPAQPEGEHGKYTVKLVPDSVD